MGIQGLLPLLKEIQVHGNIKEFRGKRLAVDAYVWLHKGAFGCAEDLVKGKKTTKFVDYAMHRVRLLRYHGITPFIVFDGGPLPAKKGTEESRAKSRAENLDRATTLESQGRWKEARDYYTKCVDITPEMAYQLIKALRAENVEYVVAPYEADAQLCFLEREGYVDGIITEDSDLLVFGCKQVIFKLDGNGDCVWIHRDKFATVSAFPMHGWTDVQFRRMAMLSGCDYLDNIKGLGLRTAHRLLRKHKTVEKVLQHIRLEGALRVSDNYAAAFAQAELAFIHQRVFCPAQRKLVPLTDFPESGLAQEDERWIGLDVDMSIARGMAAGDLHPETRLPIEDQWPDYMPQAPGSGNASNTSTNKRPAPLGPSTSINANRTVSSGPLDAFVSRSKRPRTSPALPTPIGVFGSGPSRLSDQALRTRSAPGRLGGLEDILGVKVVDVDSNRREGGEMKKSKFFSARSGRGRRDELEEVVEKEREGMVWESSDPPDIMMSGDVLGEVSSNSASPDKTPGASVEVGVNVDGDYNASAGADADVRSPSPIVSSLRPETSPPRLAATATQPIDLTSPPLSSPISSPVRKRPPPSSPPDIIYDSLKSPSPPRAGPGLLTTTSTSNRQDRGKGRVVFVALSSPTDVAAPMRSQRGGEGEDRTPVKKGRGLVRLSNVLVPMSSSPLRAQAQAQLQTQTQTQTQMPDSMPTTTSASASASDQQKHRYLQSVQTRAPSVPAGNARLTGSIRTGTGRRGHSSDSIEEDEMIVTPSAEMGLRRQSTSAGRRKSKSSKLAKVTARVTPDVDSDVNVDGKMEVGLGIEADEIDDVEIEDEEQTEARKEEERREQDARAVAMGWREKYALKPTTPLGSGRRYLPDPRLATPRNITAANTTATTSSIKRDSSFAVAKQSGAVRLTASVPRVLATRELNLRSDKSSSSPISEGKLDAKRSPGKGKGKGLDKVDGGRGQRESSDEEEPQLQSPGAAPSPGPPRAVLGSGTSWKGLERFMFAGKVQREVRPFG